MITSSRFKKTIRDFYKKNRRELPWRNTRDPYKILVSEVMLQQTQVDRVIPFYLKWLKRFPTARTLAFASVRDALALWSGLGYNRRAIQLKRAAELIITEHKGKFPRSVEAIDALPGVGHYTATAVAAFAFNTPGACIETNIRSVYLHFFFPHQQGVSDKKLLPIIEKTLDRKNPREWYYALMDYGSYLKKQTPNPSRRSAHHLKQSKFVGSNRQLRGAILRTLLQSSALPARSLAAKTRGSLPNVNANLAALRKEGMVKKTGARYSLA